jgi:O-antigen ligase
VVSRASDVVLACGFFVIVGAISLGFGLFAGRSQWLFFEGLAILIGGTLCAVGPKCRFALTVGGALVVFQSDLTILKYAYLALAIVCFSLSLKSILDPAGKIREEFKFLVVCSALLLGYLSFTWVISHSIGTPFDLWFRDVLPYLLIAVLPYIGIEAGIAISPQWSRRWIITIGLVSSAGLAAEWLNRRGVSALPFGGFVLSSTVIPALCFAYAITKAGLPSSLRRGAWTATAALILVAVLVSGSRSSLTLPIAFLGVIGTPEKFRLSPRKAAGLLFGIVASLLVIAPVAAQLFVSDPNFLSGRLNDTLSVIGGNGESDGSYGARRESYSLTTEAFANHPTLGTGPGYLYSNPPARAFNLDAPGIVPAKFGLVGMAIIALFLVSVIVTIRRIQRSYGPSPAITAARGWSVVLIVLVPLGPWIEDKGFALALAILFGLVLADARPGVAEHSRHSAPPPHSWGGASGRAEGRVLGDTSPGVGPRRPHS